MSNVRISKAMLTTQRCSVLHQWRLAPSSLCSMVWTPSFSMDFSSPTQDTLGLYIHNNTNQNLHERMCLIVYTKSIFSPCSICKQINTSVSSSKCWYTEFLEFHNLYCTGPELRNLPFLNLVSYLFVHKGVQWTYYNTYCLDRIRQWDYKHW